MREDIRVWSKKQLKVLAAAEQLFIAHGLERVSVKQIAEAAETGITQIFYYFINKEQLLQAVLQWRLTQIQERLETAVLQPALTLQQQLELITEEYIEQGLRNPLVLTQLFYTNNLAPDAANAVTPDVLAEKSPVLVREVIVRAQQEGKVKQGVNAMQVAALITGTVTCMVLNKEEFRIGCGLQHLDEPAFRQQLQQAVTTQLHNVLQSIMIYE